MSTKKQKPSKPSRLFPLYAHACGQWAKKVKGSVYYFGKWDDPDSALDQWIKVKDELLAGRQPVVWDLDSLTVGECLNIALAAKKQAVKSLEISQQTWDDYEAAGKRVLEVFDRNKPVKMLTPRDFQLLRQHLQKDCVSVTLANRIRHTRVLFNWCENNGHIESMKPIWGTAFGIPSARQIRLDRNSKPKRFTPADRIRKLLASAGEFSNLKAMILLGINCAYGPKDCCLLKWSHLNLKSGWACLPRNKTGKDRKAKLWPETVAALGGIDAGDDGLIFRTLAGQPQTTWGIGHAFARLKAEGEPFGFYWLRHTFSTIGEGSLDFEAVRVIMGHIDASVAGHYRSGVSDERLEAVSDYVRNWLFEDSTDTKSKPTGTP